MIEKGSDWWRRWTNAAKCSQCSGSFLKRVSDVHLAPEDQMAGETTTLEYKG